MSLLDEFAKLRPGAQERACSFILGLAAFIIGTILALLRII